MPFGLQTVSDLCSPTAISLSIRVLILLRMTVAFLLTHVYTVRHVLMPSHSEVLEVLPAADEPYRDSV